MEVITITVMTVLEPFAFMVSETAANQIVVRVEKRLFVLGSNFLC